MFATHFYSIVWYLFYADWFKLLNEWPFYYMPSILFFFIVHSRICWAKRKKKYGKMEESFLFFICSLYLIRCLCSLASTNDVQLMPTVLSNRNMIVYFACEAILCDISSPDLAYFTLWNATHLCKYIFICIY